MKNSQFLRTVQDQSTANLLTYYEIIENERQKQKYMKQMTLP